MSTRAHAFSRVPRHAPLAACLAAGLGLTSSAALAGEAQLAQLSLEHGHAASALDLPAYLRLGAMKPQAALMGAPIKPTAPPHYVTTCVDDANVVGSLRYEVNHAGNNDTIDLSTLVCSTITLSSAINVHQDSLYLKGPASDTASLTIDGNDQFEVFAHFGYGTLRISDLTIANGHFVSSTDPTGGCIWSRGSVYLLASVVSHCTLNSFSANYDAFGAGIYARGDLTLYSSTITDSHVDAPIGRLASGGGAFVLGNFTAHYSTVSNNIAGLSGNASGLAGGALIRGSANITSSTISRNRADGIGGLNIGIGPPHTASIIDSTISGNTASEGTSGIAASIPLTLISSTVAFNRSSSDLTGWSSGLFTYSPLFMQSSIIADNEGPSGPSDLDGSAGAVVSGANNLITSSTLPLPPFTITACPQLKPLASNGGPTLTHALPHTSPAIDQGDAGILTVDQRGAPRVAGTYADIGSVEHQPGETDERVFVSGFDGLCDQ